MNPSEATDSQYVTSQQVTAPLVSLIIQQTSDYPYSTMEEQHQSMTKANRINKNNNPGGQQLSISNSHRASSMLWLLPKRRVHLIVLQPCQSLNMVLLSISEPSKMQFACDTDDVLHV